MGMGSRIISNIVGLLALTFTRRLDAVLPDGFTPESCWKDGFNYDFCCDSTSTRRAECFDWFYTEEFCCGFGRPTWISDHLCNCSITEENLIREVTDALAMSDKLSMPADHTSNYLCEAYLAEGLKQVCYAIQIVGNAICAHSHAIVKKFALAAKFAEDARKIAATVTNRSTNHCREGLRKIVHASFPFSEAEVIRNADNFRKLAGGPSNGNRGWRRELKPILGSHSELDALAWRYKASSRMQVWQKQWGCSGGDLGEDNNAYSYQYHKIFDHSKVDMGPSRHLPTRVLELGVCDGSGVAVWTDYFYHSESRVVALDLDFMLFSANRLILMQRGFDISRLAAIIQINASNISGLALVTTGWSFPHQTEYVKTGFEALVEHGPFDFIREDASHRASDMIATFESIFPTPILSPGGVYVVEDMWSYPYKKDVRTSLDESNEYTYFFRLARDSLNLGWRYDGLTQSADLMNSWIQSSRPTALEAWVDRVEFSRGQTFIWKRHR